MLAFRTCEVILMRFLSCRVHFIVYMSKKADCSLLHVPLVFDVVDRPVGGALWLSCLQATAPPAGAASSEASFVLKMKIGFGIRRRLLR